MPYLSQKETGLIRRISFNFLMQRLTMHQILAINTDFAVVVQLFRMVKKVCNIKMISSYNCLKKGPTIKFRK